MNVTIWDLDWYYKKSFLPNVDCMRLSSYHKQRGDIINFIENEFDLDINFDIIYIKKDKDETPMPERKWIDDNRTILLGKGFRYYHAKQLNSVIIACRPDYLLYKIDEKNSYANANFITFFAGKTLIKNRQDYHNTKKHMKRTLVTDSYLWNATKEEIIYCLESLKSEKNIVFLEPISLRTVISDKNITEKFLALNFSKGTIFKWRNDLPQTIENCKDIINFLIKLKNNTKSDIGFIPIKGIILDHMSNETNYKLDFVRCISIINEFKCNNLKCRILVGEKEQSPKIEVFKQLEVWTKHSFELSYVEFILHPICYKSGILWYNILNNPIRWRNNNIDFLLYLLTGEEWDNIREMLYIQTGNCSINYSKINFKLIKEEVNLLYRS